MALIDELRTTLPAKPPETQDPLRQVKDELGKYVREMKNLRRMEPGNAMAWLSSVSARVLEVMLWTLESDHRVFTKYRIEHLIPIRDELRFQYSIASRRHSVDTHDWELSGGQET